MPQITNFFPKEINIMVDLFCGGATVGLNVECSEVYFIDSNQKIVNLLKFLAKQEFNVFLLYLEELINKFGLSYSYRNTYSFYRAKCQNIKDNNGLKDYNSKAYYEMRFYYNNLLDKNNAEANAILYLLMIYGFNNDIRFNNKAEFNLPIGKTDLNKLNAEKLKNYMSRCSKIKAHFICASYTDINISKIIDKADFVYMDPPYLITDAVYNVGWGEKEEKDLLIFIDGLIERKKNFALSNILSKINRDNIQLVEWCQKNSNYVFVNDITYHYRSCSYHKSIRESNEREVLISSRYNI